MLFGLFWYCDGCKKYHSYKTKKEPFKSRFFDLNVNEVCQEWYKNHIEPCEPIYEKHHW